MTYEQTEGLELEKIPTVHDIASDDESERSLKAKQQRQMVMNGKFVPEIIINKMNTIVSDEDSGD